MHTMALSRVTRNSGTDGKYLHFAEVSENVPSVRRVRPPDSKSGVNCCHVGWSREWTNAIKFSSARRMRT
jgi:hypothetical protein